MFDKIIYELELAREERERLELLGRLEEALRHNREPEKNRLVKSLLYHRNWYVRREAAFLIDRFGVSLTETERLQYAYALQNFSFLKKRMEEGDREARRLLFAACQDAAPRIRARVLAFLRAEDCHNTEEEVLLHYAASDYLTLMELGTMPDYREPVIRVLEQGMRQKENPVYHRKQCVFCLEQLKAMDDAHSVIREILTETEPAVGDPRLPEQTPPPVLSPLEQLLQALRLQGIYLDGRRVYPDIRVGTVTGRIIYKNPPLQIMDKTERLHRISPSPGKVLLRFDYVCMEPNILLHYLLERFLINTEDIPEDDIYLSVNPSDRKAGKRWLNAVINGGGHRYARQLNPFQQKLWNAIRELRIELVQEGGKESAVKTLGGREIRLSVGVRNYSGKLMNRLIQGSASDVFNRAVTRLYLRFTEEMREARVYFLLFDEVWVECPEDQTETVRKICEQILRETPGEMGLLLPLPVKTSQLEKGGV